MQSNPIVCVLYIRVSVRYGLKGVYALSISLRTAEGLVAIPGSPLSVVVGVARLENRLYRWYEETESYSAALRSTEGLSLDSRSASIAKVLREWKRAVGRNVLTRLLHGLGQNLRGQL